MNAKQGTVSGSARVGSRRATLIFRLGWVGLAAIFLAGPDHGIAGAQDSGSERVLKAGAAQVDITPPLGESVVGGFEPFPATAVHDRLHARCLILDNGQTQVGFVICDNLGIRREVYDQARNEIQKALPLDPGKILMAATHTHSATTSSSPKYVPQLVDGIVQAVRLAWEQRVPARIGWGSVEEPSEVFNRRWFVTDQGLLKNPFGGVDRVRMNPPRGHASLVEPAGPVDPEISFLTVQTVDGKPLALLANYSLHYVGGVPRGEISADYFGIFARRIAELLGAGQEQPAFVGMLSNGTSGDVNNINFRERDSSHPPYEKMRLVAEKIAERVHQAHQAVEFHEWVPLGSAGRELTLRFRKPGDEMQAYLASLRSQPDDAPRHHRYELIYADRVQRLLEGPDEVSIPLQVVRVGQVAVAAVPFEVFTEIGLEIKRLWPTSDAFTIELANDYHGYLPTPRHHELGGYETWMGTNRVQLDASDRIVEVLADLMRQVETPTPPDTR